MGFHMRFPISKNRVHVFALEARGGIRQPIDLQFPGRDDFFEQIWDGQLPLDKKIVDPSHQVEQTIDLRSLLDQSLDPGLLCIAWWNLIRLRQASAKGDE